MSKVDPEVDVLVILIFSRNVLLSMGTQSRIECIFFSEFHPTLGPKITYQVGLRTQRFKSDVKGIDRFQNINVTIGEILS